MEVEATAFSGVAVFLELACFDLEEAHPVQQNSNAATAASDQLLCIRCGQIEGPIAKARNRVRTMNMQTHRTFRHNRETS
jgi:hypothetical protein